MGKTEDGGKSPLDLLNERDDLYIVVAGAGHKLLNDGRLKRADAAVFNFFRDDVHIKSLTPPRTDLTYFVASHCTREYADGTPSIYKHLQDAGAEVRLWHAHLYDGQRPDNGKVLIGGGTGAPVSVMTVFAAMGHGDFEFFGCDGSTAYVTDMGDVTRHAEFVKNNEMFLKMDGRKWGLHTLYWEQTKEMIELIQGYPDRFPNVHFRGDNIHAAIFNTPDGKPRQDFEIVDAQGNKFEQRLET